MPVALPTTVNVRYMVHAVDAANHMVYETSVLTNVAPAFANVTPGSLRLLALVPEAVRLHLSVDDLAGEVARLHAAGAQFPQ